MSGWIAIAVSVLMAIITASIGVGVIRAKLEAISAGQEELQHEFLTAHVRLELAMTELGKAVALLTTTGAVNTTQHEEFARRIVLLEEMLLEHTAQIGALRTRTHVHANKLHELDPKWKSYGEEQG